MRFTLVLTLMVFMGAPPSVSGQATPLTDIALDDLSAFQSPSPNWQIVGAYSADLEERHAFAVREGEGILANIQTEEARGNLFTVWEHADIELDVEVMMPAGSNSGLYFQSRYEIQLFDSWGVDPPRHSDLGGIYQRWDESRPEGERGYEGHPPRVNVARAPGLWQHLNVIFKAPRFDATGRKVENARFVKVTLNDVVIHENVEVFGPTRAAAFDDEAPNAPLMIQGDHGPVAFRNMKYRLFDPASVTIDDVRLAYYRGTFSNQLPDLDELRKEYEKEVEAVTAQDADTFKLFAMEYTGTLSAPVSGVYLFEVSHSSRFALEIDGEEVLTDNSERISRVGEFTRNAAEVNLPQGDHAFRLLYAKGQWHNHPVLLGWYVTGPGLLRTELTAEGSVPADAFAAFEVKPAQRPRLQRNFVMHGDRKRTHAISVGYPAGLHYAYDLSLGALLSVWKGPFVDASTMWYQRGNLQSALPLGSVIERSGRPTVALLDDDNAAWPDTLETYTFKRYRLSENGDPTFAYELEGLTVEDQLRPDADHRMLVRTLDVRGEADNAWVLLARSGEIAEMDESTYAVDGQLMYIQTDGEGAAAIVDQGSTKELRMPVPLVNGAARITYKLIW